MGDITAGLFGVIGILAALHERAATGQGALVDVAMLDCQVAILENAMLDLMYELPSRDDVEECVVNEEAIEQGSDPLLVYKREAESA